MLDQIPAGCNKRAALAKKGAGGMTRALILKDFPGSFGF
jgi:hypothetical protein